MVSEEDIKILEDTLKDKEQIIKYHSWIGTKSIQAIENLIKDYKDLHLAYELYKSKYEKKKEDNEKLEEDNKKNSIVMICYQEELENSIPKSLVQEKIKEIDEKIKHEDNEKVIVQLHKQKRVLEELLKGDKQ